MTVEKGKPQKNYQIKITDLATGEVLYQHHSFGGVVAQVEEATLSGADVVGVHQIIGWGHPLAQFYGVDQMNRYFSENIDKFVETLIQSGIITGDIEALRAMFKKKYHGN